MEDGVTEPSSTWDHWPCQRDLTFSCPLLQQGRGGDARSQTVENLRRLEDLFCVCSEGFCGGFLEPSLIQINNHKNIDFSLTRCVTSHFQFDSRACHSLSLVSN